jgi:hypothetical protein
MELIDKACIMYYDKALILPAPIKDGENDVLESSLVEKLEEVSFMQNNKSEEIDKIKYYWAFNMPCALLVN